MDALEMLTTRRSYRTYSDKPVERAVLEKVVEAGQYAPSGMGKQGVHFVVVQDKETRDAISRMNAQVMGVETDPFYGAPTVVVVFADTTVPTSADDGALAMGNLLNAAHALGVNSCWIHRAKEVFESEEGRKLLERWGLPTDGTLRGVGNCILGYAPEGTLAPTAAPRHDNVTWVG